jgi:hypothetical protein
VGVLVGVTVGLMVEVGTGVLLGDGVLLGMGVMLGAIVVTLGRLPTATSTAPLPTRLQPPATKGRITPRPNPASTNIEILFLPLKMFIINTSKSGPHYTRGRISVCEARDIASGFCERCKGAFRSVQGFHKKEFVIARSDSAFFADDEAIFF